MLWWLHPCIHHFRLYFFSDSWKWGRKEPVKLFRRRWRLPGFILPDSTFVLNPSSGKRLCEPSCSQNKLTFGFRPIVFENHSPLMTMMQSYKLASIRAAHKCKLCFAQTQQGGGGGGYSGAACSVLTNTNTRGCKRQRIFSQRQDGSAGWRRI